MKIFALVIAIATVLGGFVGGEIMDKAFSITGAVLGGGGLAAGLLSLGAYFTAQDEKRKRQSLPPEMIDVFDRMTGKKPYLKNGGASAWTPRPFHKNESKEDFRIWFENVVPWKRLDPRISEALIERLYGNPMFEVFVHTAQDQNLVPKFESLPLNGPHWKATLYTQVAGILLEAGAGSTKALHALLFSGQIKNKKVETLYGWATDATEAAIHVEPNLAHAYLQMAGLKGMFGRKDESAAFCKQGLEVIGRLRKAPMHLSKIESVRNASVEFDELEKKLHKILADVQS